MRVVMVEVGRKACEMELENRIRALRYRIGGIAQALHSAGR